MSNPFHDHHDFFGTQATPAPEAPTDDKQAERIRNRITLARPFFTPEGQESLQQIRKLAEHLPAEPIDYPDADKTHQLLVWRAARVALVKEIEALVQQESQR